MIPNSPWTEENQDGGHSKEDYDDRCDVGAIFFSGRGQMLFKIVCN